MQRMTPKMTLRATLLAGSCMLLGACAQTTCPDGECAADGDTAISPKNGESSSVSEKSKPEIDPIAALGVDKQEPVQSIRYDGEHITFETLSNGCTVIDHFHIEHAVADGQCQITLVRDQMDMCRRAPAVAELSMPWTLPDGCTAETVSFTNPVVDLQSTIKKPRRPSLPADDG